MVNGDDEPKKNSGKNKLNAGHTASQLSYTDPVPEGIPTLIPPLSPSPNLKKMKVIPLQKLSILRNQNVTLNDVKACYAYELP
jgi:hypothetical protein